MHQLAEGLQLQPVKASMALLTAFEWPGFLKAIPVSPAAQPVAYWRIPVWEEVDKLTL